MKKALALVLALVLALSMAVSAFAAPVELDSASTLTKDNRLALKELAIYDGESGTALNAVKPTYKVDAKGGEFYFFLQDGNNYYAKLKNFETTANGAVVAAEMVAFDGDTMLLPAGLVFVVTDGENNLCDAQYRNLVTGDFNKDYTAQETASTKAFEAPKYKDANGNEATYEAGVYEYAVALAKYLNAGAQVSAKYKVVPAVKDGFTYTTANLYVLKVTVAENYTAAYAEGDFKVTAYNTETKKTVSFAADVISDVTIFEYEQVKYAAKEEAALVLGAKGYSDFETALNGYGEKYVVEGLRKLAGASVVSTTAFRAIEGKDLTVSVLSTDKQAKVEGEVAVTVKAVAAAQKGVNFAFYGLTEVDENDVAIAISKKPIDAIAFGFYGNQVIASDFEIEVDLEMNAYELRETFGLKVEEEDIINYYVVDENGAVVKTIKVDYMVDDIAEDIEFTIEGKAGDTLGAYEITLDVPAAETVETEENPNTGAESVVGVVAALAVVSVATAAAVSLKK